MKPGEASITSDEMQSVELNSEFLGVTHFQLMETVGSKIAVEIASRVRGKSNPKIHVVAGTGKNGGDGIAVARHLASLGFNVKITLVGKADEVCDHAAKHQLNSILQMQDSVELETVPDSSQLRPVEADFIVDALLGTGVRGDLRQPLLGAVRMINKSKGYKVAIDLPSGLDTDTGQPHGEAVKADLTISLHKTKQGLLKSREYVGELLVLSIGIPPEAETYAGPGDFKILWKPRPPEAHKGQFGRLLVIGGSENYTGAPTFSALAATKCGTDLVYVASPQKASEIISSYSPDLITIRLPGDHLNPKALVELEPWVKLADAVVIGPGIGLHEETADAIWKLISAVESLGKTLVLDADALKIFGRRRRKFKTTTVLTPHAGEFTAISQRKLSTDQKLRQEAVVQLAKEIGATIILKGHVDIIADERRVKLNKTGNPYMTVGGTGDLLTGIVGGLVAQKIDSFQASVAAAFLNGIAGDMLIAEKGPAIIPSNLLEYIPKAMKYCVDGPPYPSIKK